MHAVALLLQNQPDPELVQKMAMAMIPIFFILMLIGIAIVMVPFWFILKKAGFSPWLSLLCIVPLGMLVLLYIVAFADWRVLPVSGAMWQGQPPYPHPPQAPYPPQA